MRSPAKTRLVGASAAILAQSLCFAAGTSWAADSGLVINEQIQLGDVFSTQTLNVEDVSEAVDSAATAVGNSVTAVGRNSRLDFQSSQELGAKSAAATQVVVGGEIDDYYQSQTSATGNTGTAGTCCALTLGSSVQNITSAGEVTAEAAGQTGSPAASISADSMAVGNTQGWNQVGGDLQAFTRQDNDGARTFSTNTGLFYGSHTHAGFSAAGVANNVTVDAEDAYVDVGVEQSRTGSVVGAVNTRVGSTVSAEALATANGNLVDIAASGPDTHVSVKQDGTGGLDAYANMTLDQWTGDANAIAYGVGNSVMLSNLGPVTGMYVEQTSGGDINGTASISAGAGGAMYVSSSAVGNALTASVCAECAGDLNATGRQVNNSRVRSQSNVSVSGRVGQIAAESFAVGNSASYEVRGNRGE